MLRAHASRASRTSDRGACTVRSGRGPITARVPARAHATAGTTKPFVYRQISSSLFWASSPTRRLRVRVGLARAARVVALWKGAAETLQDHFGVRQDHIRVIPNAVVPERFSPVDV